MKPESSFNIQIFNVAELVYGVFDHGAIFPKRILLNTISVFLSTVQKLTSCIFKTAALIGLGKESVVTVRKSSCFRAFQVWCSEINLLSNIIQHFNFEIKHITFVKLEVLTAVVVVVVVVVVVTVTS